MQRFIPSLGWLKSYKRSDFLGDLPAGLTVGVMLIPQGMAYALIAGLPVVYGLYAALVPQVVYAFLGSSRQLAVGPVAMDSLLVASGLTGLAVAGSDRYIELALLLALMMGGMQLLLGMLRMGFLARFLSRPVISGFTSAAALIIALNQLPSLLGIEMGRSAHLHELALEAARALGSSHFPTLLLSASAVLVLFVLRKWAPRVPGALVVVAAGIGFVTLVGAETYGIRTIGAIPSGLPHFSMPGLHWDDIRTLAPVAATIALIAFMEAFSLAQAVSQRRGDHTIDANQELRALGLANFFGSMFGAYPTTGGFSRTAVNERAGAMTGVSALISAAVVGLTLAFLTPVFRHLPQAVLGAIIVVAVAGLFDVKYARDLWRSHREEALLLLATFGLTAVGGMVLGIAAGVVLSLVLTLYRSTRPHAAELGAIAGIYRNVERFPKAALVPGWLIVRYDGPLHYASQAHFQEFLKNRLAARGSAQPVHTILLHAESIPYIDASACAMLSSLLDEWQHNSITFKLAGTIGPARDALHRCGLMERIGTAHFHTNVEDALHEQEDSQQQKIATQTALSEG